MKKGDLVRGKQDRHELGIVLKVAKDQATVFLGDGLPCIVAIDNWEALPFCEGASIPANFAELVGAYEQVKIMRQPK